nr:hypothetical protein [Tanacetum cinerariifolium]
MSYLSDFEELNGGYVAFGGNPKGEMAQPTARNHAHRGNHKYYAQMTHQNPQKHMVHAAVLTQSKPVSITAVRPVSTAFPKTSVTRPKQVKPIVTKTNSPPKRHTNQSLSLKFSNSPLRVTTVKASVVSVAQGNMSYLSNFEELNGGYVAFGGNPKGGKISGKVLTQSKPVPITVVRPVSTVVSKTSVTRPKQVKPVVTKPNSPTRRHSNRSPSPKASNSPPRVTAVKALVVNAAQGLQG